MVHRLLVLTSSDTIGCVGNIPSADGGVARRESLSKVVNAKMVLAAVKSSGSDSETLYVAPSFGGQGLESGHGRVAREVMPELYNDLWDLTLDCNKLGKVESVVLNIGALEFLKTPAGHKVEKILYAGQEIDPSCPAEFEQSSKLVSLESQLEEEVRGEPFVLYDNVNEKLPKFRCVAVGGTFDHMHNGHKKLLSICLAVLESDGELVCGVTHRSMLGEKKGGDMIEDVEKRKDRVREFLDAVAPSTLKRSIVTIEDVWGPTASREDIEGIVVSTEVIKGARLINAERAKRGFRPLSVVAVARSNVYTLSSTFVRTHTANI